MKKIVLFSIISALSLVTMAQTSTTQTPAMQDESAVDTVNLSPGNRITLPERRYYMSPDQFYDFKGSYSLANGMTLSMYSTSFGLMYARLNNQESHRIIATEANTFVALDKQLKMHIDLKDNGDAGGYVLMALPSQISANGDVIGDRLVVGIAK